MQTTQTSLLGAGSGSVSLEAPGSTEDLVENLPLSVELDSKAAKAERPSGRAGTLRMRSTALCTRDENLQNGCTEYNFPKEKI